MAEFFHDRVKTLWEKKKKCLLPAFSHFPTTLSKGFFLRVMVMWDCSVKGENAHCYDDFSAGGITSS